MGFKTWSIFILRGLAGIVLIPIWFILVLFVLMNMVYKNVIGVFAPKQYEEFLEAEEAE